MATKNNENDLLAAMGVAEQKQQEKLADPNEILMALMEASSHIQMGLIAFQERLSNIESHVSYLLSKNPEFMANLEKAEAAKKAEAEAGKSATDAAKPATEGTENGNEGQAQ